MFQRTSRKSVSSSDILQCVSDVTCLMEILEAARVSQEMPDLFTFYHLYARHIHLDELKQKLKSGDFTVVIDADEATLKFKHVDSSWLRNDAATQLKELIDLSRLADTSLNAFPEMLSSVKKIFDYNAKKNIDEVTHAVALVRKDSSMKGPQSPTLRRLKTEERLALESYPSARSLSPK